MIMKRIILSLLVLMIFVSCAPHKNMAYDFVKKSKGASVAFYVPNELKKTNMRADCKPENPEFASLDEAQLQDTINSRIKILNSIDNEVFLNVMIASFEETLKDYNLTLNYWENDNKTPDSLHWIVDLSHMEIQETIGHQITTCGAEGNYELFPVTRINVASWFDLLNGDNHELVFTEQNYEDYIVDCQYSLDSVNNLIANVEFHNVSLDGFYDFAVMLGKLYAGYTFDFFMNEYVKKEMKKKEKEYSDEIFMRYDPYEAYIYYTTSDRLVRINE